MCVCLFKLIEELASRRDMKIGKQMPNYMITIKF